MGALLRSAFYCLAIFLIFSQVTVSLPVDTNDGLATNGGNGTQGDNKTETANAGENAPVVNKTEETPPIIPPPPSNDTKKASNETATPSDNTVPVPPVPSPNETAQPSNTSVPQPPPVANETKPVASSNDTVQPVNASIPLPPPAANETKPVASSNDTVQPLNASIAQPPPATNETKPVASSNDTVQPVNASIAQPPPATNETKPTSSSNDTVQPVDAPSLNAVLNGLVDNANASANQSVSNSTVPVDESDKPLEADVRDVDLGSSPGNAEDNSNATTSADKTPEDSTTEKIATLEELEALDNGEEGSGSADDHDALETHIGHDHHNHTDGEGTVGASHHGDTEEDNSNKTRNAIIIGVAIGAVAVFALLFFTSRKCKRRGDFKPIGNDDGVEIQPMPPAAAAKEPEQSNNGLYRHGPKMGPPSPRMHRKGDGKFEFPQSSEAPMSKSLNVPNNKSPVSESPYEPFLNDADNVRYIDESTDDELTSVKDKLLPDPKLSQVVELSPPSSPVLNGGKPEAGGDAQVV